MRGAAGSGLCGHGGGEAEAAASLGRPERQGAANRGEAFGHAVQATPRGGFRGIRGLAGDTVTVVGDLEGQLTRPLGEPDPAVPGAGVADHVGDGLAQAPGQHRLGVRVEGAGPQGQLGVVVERYAGRKTEGGNFHIWIRATGKLPDEPAIHQCVLAYASDMMLLDSALIPHGRTVFERTLMAASLDHALWFHRPFRADDWLLYAQDSPNLFGARGFARGLIFARDGTLVASVAQEGLLRERRAPAAE